MFIHEDSKLLNSLKTECNLGKLFFDSLLKLANDKHKHIC
jgi:hypothetical protein